MDDKCPLCLTGLMNLNAEDQSRFTFYCKTCACEEVTTRFQISYSRKNNETLYYNLYWDRYRIESIYPNNTTKISLAEPTTPIHYRSILHFPLIRFEQDDLDKIKKKLKLLLMMNRCSK